MCDGETVVTALAQRLAPGRPIVPYSKARVPNPEFCAEQLEPEPHPEPIDFHDDGGKRHDKIDKRKLRNLAHLDGTCVCSEEHS
jgi:hypothetical protein